MGVKGLLPCLQSITRSVSLERYRGLTVAVDAMSWLHKGVFACDVKALAKSQRSEQSAEPTQAELKCVNYTTNKAETLQAKFGISVILVIDGDALPSKKEENAQRREERDKAFEKAMAAEQARDSRTARRFYAQSCSVTHKIRYELIKACKQLGIAFLVAPYEADAQMARLAHTGAVDLVITEDSDILVYGCPRALFKVDFDTCQGQEIQLMRDLGQNVSPSFRNFTHDMFVFMAIISGCDYCKGVQGIGIKLAHKLVRVHRTPSKIFSALRLAGRMPPDFEDKFWIAFRTFRHQRVYCPSKQQIETLWPIAGSSHGASPNEVWPFLGEHIEPRTAAGIADGTLHPSKKVPWTEALKAPPGNGSSMQTNLDDMQIHRRTSAVTSGRGNRVINNGKENVWYSLVYGRKDAGTSNPRQQNCNDKGNDHPHESQDGRPKSDMFGFFPRNKTHGGEHGAAKPQEPPASSTADSARPPLNEIYVGADADQPTTSKYAPPANHRDVPIHFNEYASRLVGRAFKPISRKRKKHETDGSKSSKFVQKIWEKCAAQRPTGTQQRPKEEQNVPQDGKEKEREKNTEGVSLFQRSKDDKRDDVGKEEDSQDYFRAHLNHDTFTYGEDYSPQEVPLAYAPTAHVDYRARDQYCHHQVSGAQYEDEPVHHWCDETMTQQQYSDNATVHDSSQHMLMLDHCGHDFRPQSHLDFGCVDDMTPDELHYSAIIPPNEYDTFVTQDFIDEGGGPCITDDRDGHFYEEGAEVPVHAEFMQIQTARKKRNDPHQLQSHVLMHGGHDEHDVQYDANDDDASVYQQLKTVVKTKKPSYCSQVAQLPLGDDDGITYGCGDMGVYDERADPFCAFQQL